MTSKCLLMPCRELPEYGWIEVADDDIVPDDLSEDPATASKQRRNARSNFKVGLRFSCPGVIVTVPQSGNNPDRHYLMKLPLPAERGPDHKTRFTLHFIFRLRAHLHNT